MTLTSFPILAFLFLCMKLILTIPSDERGAQGRRDEDEQCRIETIMTVFDYHAFEFFGKLPYGLALYFFVLEYKISS